MQVVEDHVPWRGVRGAMVVALSGKAWPVRHAATAGSLTKGSSLKVAIVSSVM
jgi:hypothetical protein